MSLAAACGSSSSGSGGGSSKIAVSLITKDSINPFFVAMQKGAKAAAATNGVNLSIGAGAKDGDEQGQVTLIENAIAKGQKGIL
ncbi:MAG: substrate-binding domain-containing protein, partial [Actinomycetota bacterium]|nr:substrate-binding domain-containing protein [Actinomycetota bacterium]